MLQDLAIKHRKTYKYEGSKRRRDIFSQWSTPHLPLGMIMVQIRVTNKNNTRGLYRIFRSIRFFQQRSFWRYPWTRQAEPETPEGFPNGVPSDGDVEEIYGQLVLVLLKADSIFLGIFKRFLESAAHRSSQYSLATNAALVWFTVTLRGRIHSHCSHDNVIFVSKSVKLVIF